MHGTLSALLACLATLSHCLAAPLFPNGTRNKLTWPFSSTSFWNTAIGSDAEYVPAGITAPPRSGVDPDWFIVVPQDGWEMVPWFADHSWEQRCGTSDKFFGWVPFGADQIVPDATLVPHSTPNNAAAILQTDGATLLNMNPIARCRAHGPLFGGETPAGRNDSIYGEGRFGGHGGSGMSSIGGTVRKGELLPGAGPISHALKWEFWGAKFYYSPPDGNASECFQWPAMRCDGYWQEKYNGSNPHVRPGALLAVPPSNESAVNASLRTEPGRALLRALVDYGAYIVSDTAWDEQQFCVEHGVAEEFESAWGLKMSGDVPPAGSPPGPMDFVHDVALLADAMYAVANSAERSVGGGGVPRHPPPPPIGN